MIRLLLGCLAISLGVSTSSAQDLAKAEGSARQHLANLATRGDLSLDDLRDVVVDHAYTDEQLGITYVYLQQRIGAVPIEGAVASVGLRGERVYSFTHRMVGGVAKRTVSVVPSLDDARAAAQAFSYLAQPAVPVLHRKAVGISAPGLRHYDAPAFAHADLTIQDVFHLGEDGKLRRAFAVSVDLRQGDLHRVFVDARSGETLRDQVLTLHCSFDQHFNVRQYAAESGDCDPSLDAAPVSKGVEGLRHTQAFAKSAVTTLNDGAKYRVFPWPAESPSHGTWTLVENPADPLASPFGWHDTNGRPGPEFTITRGNNTHAFLDLRDTDESMDDEPNGGANLIFDFPFNPAVEPIDQPDATTTNLFYSVNMMHDFAWHYGFNEPAGNFQSLNYTGLGQDDDHVLAHSEDGGRFNQATNLPDDTHLNNANFSAPPDGINGRMQMYLWNRNATGNPLKIASPASLAGSEFGELGFPAAGEWGRGAYVDSTTNVSAPIFEVRDVSAGNLATDGCDNYVNPAGAAGKIAIIDRGTCEFGAKALRAQRNGAVGVIICGFDEILIGMSAGVSGSQVNIPTFFVTRSTCQLIRQQNATFSDYRLSIKRPDRLGTAYVSGSLDNGIIAHEYGHGISIRLTGGPNVSCLGSAEQMGEGWSDFFTLVTSVRAGDLPETRRGVGTFVERQPNDASGIRPYPYSTDMSINPVTYEGVANIDAFSQPHGIGSIWASMLWDLHWNMVDRYGFSDNLFGDTLGNNKAIQLVMTGMKLQPCNPGFVDGRNAILQADSILYGGANQKLIWETFARRGLGADADQGDPDDRTDGVVGFQLPLNLADRTFVTKEVTPLVPAGGEVDVKIVFANYIDSVATLPSLTITDALPKFSTLVPGSVNFPFTQNGDVLSFDFSNVSKGDSITITYKYITPAEASQLYWYEPLDEASDFDNFDRYNDIIAATSFFKVTTDYGFGDDFSIELNTRDEETRPVLEIYDQVPILVQGTRPMFSFFHQYSIVTGEEAGIMEIYDLDKGYWESLPKEKIIRNGYTKQVSYQTFTVPFLEGFAGQQLDEWEQVLVDLDDYVGKRVLLRWRFGRRADGRRLGFGWFLDEFAHIDAVAYNPEGTVRIGNSVETFRAKDVGVLIDHNMIVGTEETAPEVVRFAAYPNPVNQDLTLSFDIAGGAGTIQVFSATGQLVLQQTIATGQQRAQVSMRDLASGMYAVRVEREGAVQVVRIMRQ